MIPAVKNHWYDPYFWLLLITASATSIAAYFTGNQSLTAVDNEKRQLRAYVGIESLKIECGSCDSEKYTPVLPIPGAIAKDFFRASLRNSGTTPANKLTVRINWAQTPVPQGWPNDFKFEDAPKMNIPGIVENASVAVIQPNSSYGTLGPIVDATPFIAARNKNIVLLVYGHIDYVDVFGATQWTTFCYLYEPWINQETLSTVCGRHNDAT
jgi:hypothetical protein